MGDQKEVLKLLREVDPNFGKIEKPKKVKVKWGKQKPVVQAEAPEIFSEDEIIRVDDTVVPATPEETYEEGEVEEE